MKKINLIGWLSRNSHEKQSPQRFVRYAAMLIMLLTLGVGQMWAWTISDAKVYFDNTNSDYDCGVRFVILKSDGCCVKSMELISGTNNLYYWTGTWGDEAVSDLRFASADYTTGWYGWWNDVSNFAALASAESFCSYTNTYGVSIESASKLFYAASGSTGANLTKTDLSGYSSLNYTQTLYQCVSENGGTPAKSTASIATIGISTKKLNGAKATTNSTGTIAAASNNTTAAAARTATVTMTVSSIDGNYAWVGWYSAESGGTLLESSTTYTYEASAATTVYARFSHETSHTVTVSYTCASPSATVSTATTPSIGEVTYSSQTAPTVKGYTFVNWTLGTGLSKHTSDNLTSNPIRVKTLSSGNYTLTANYSEDLTSTYVLKGEFDSWGSGVAMSKKSGHSTEDWVYCTRSFTGSESTTAIKIHDGSAWHGAADAVNTLTKQTGSLTSSNWSCSSPGNDINFKHNWTGTYEFAYNTSTNTFYVTYPEVDQLRISAASPADATNVNNFNLGAAVSNVRSVTRTLNANTTYTFKIVYLSDWYGYNSGTFTRSTSTSSNSRTLSTSGGDLTLTTDYAGSYTFNFNTSTKALSITYPTAYKVTYGKGTVNGSGSNCSAKDIDNGDAAVASNSTWVKSGNRVVLTAPAAKGGYTYDGWFDNNSGSGDAITTNANCTITVTSALTRYACYHENDYTVTVQSNDATNAGTVADDEITGHKDTKVPLPTATAKPGYCFKDWTVISGSASIDNETSATAAKVYNMTDDCTVQANFVPIWRIAGGDAAESDPSDAMGNWSTEANKITTLTITDGVMKSGTVTMTLAANTEYHFKVFNASTNKYWGNNAGSVTKITYANQATAQTLTNDAGKNQTFRSAAAGTYTFTWDVEHSKVSITYPTSHKITYGGYKTVYLEGADGTTDGGTMRAVVSEVTINSGDYVSDGVTVNFYADETDGYHPDGWYNNADYADAHRYKRTDPNVSLSSDESLLQLTSVSEDKTLYLKYKENKLTLYVSPFLASVEVYNIDGEDVIKTIDSYDYVEVGVHTGKKLKVIPDVPYYFTGWELDETPKYNIYKTDGSGAAPAENEDYAEVNVYATSECTSDVATQTLHASCKVLNAIYFRNEKEDHTPLWDSVYVGFNATWSDSDSPQGGKLGASTKGKTVLPMEKAYDNVWRVYIPRAVTRAKYHNVAFFDKGKMRNWNEFYGNNAVYRTDFDNSNDGKLNMYVPYHVKSSTDNTTNYYSTGYWKTAYTNSKDAGYYLVWRKSENTYDSVGTFVGMSDNRISCTLRLDNTSYKDYAIYDANGKRHIAVSGVTSTNYTDIRVNMDNTYDSRFGLTPTAEGNYVFTIDQSCDTMKLSVEFPVAVNDYVIENVYNDGSTKKTHTNVIKASEAETKTRYSMFISNAGGAATLKLHKCTEIDGSGNPVWSTGDATNLSGILSAEGFTPGVYQFDLTIDKANDTVSEVDSLRLYTGNFYIKTDAASGGWVHYKQNILEKNTVNFDRTSATYDHYMCKYFEKKECNIKSVIANDYCNQLSDTVKGDGIARMDGTEPYVPVDGTSIRFSYNSATNETKRAYLGASANNDFLNIDVSTDDKIYRDITVDAVTTETDMYGISGYDDLWKTRFNDNGNWVYEMDLKVKPSGKAGVTAAYTDAGSTKHVQTLIPNTNTVLGGSESSDNKYSIRIVYDFKTNFMMSSFVLDGSTINEDLSDFDMLWVRHKDESATQLTLGTGKKLTNVRPIGAIEFRYDSVNYSASHTGHWQDLSSYSPYSGWNNPFARPYLKYFVSFPFDVEVNSIFGLNQAEYGRYYHYVIQKYDGATRAKEGLFYGDGDNYWVDLEPGDTLKANEGYCVIFDNDYVSGTSGQMWDNKSTGSKVYLYFPAMKEVASITNSDEVLKVDSLTCHIDRTYTVGGKEKNHKYTDSHWHMIGNPLFHDAYIKDFTNGGDSTLKSYYYMDLTSPSSKQDWKSMAIEKETTPFKAMSSVLVQWWGTINWSKNAGVAAAPKRRTNEDKNYLAQLDIWYNGINTDQTFVRLEDGAKDGFELCEDMSKVLVKSRANLYTFTGDYDVAYNEMPVANCTIPVGVVIRKNGTYTFSMPSNFSGTVTLIDTYTQTRTNLALDDYEVYLEKGTIDDRFELEINVNKMPTAIDGAGDGSGSLKDGKAHKFIMNDMMYILNDGVLYDATGKRVK